MAVFRQQKQEAEAAGRKTGPGKKRIRIAMTALAVAAGAVIAFFAVRTILAYAAAPKTSAGHRYTSEISVRTEDGGLTQVGLSMDKVPEAYSHEPFHHGKLEKFWYTTDTYGLYGRERKKIRKYAEVYLPYGYDRSGKQRYNVVYLMHGAGGSQERFFGSALHPKAFKYIVDNMTALGEIEPMIFVSLSYYPETGMDREDDWDAQYTKYYAEELRNDVLPQVESHYHTYAESTDDAGLRASRWHRTFAGFSMGSVTTYYRLCDSLDYFHFFLGMSGSLYWGPDARESGSMADFGAAYIMDAVKKQGYTKDDFFLYSCVGSEDFALDVVNAQVSDEQNHPEFFSFGENGEPANTVFELGGGEIHHGSHGTSRYLYNALPVFSKLMGEEA